ncbi:glucuronate isomerase [Aurantimonas marianensis]|uniref:Uronate isomerase n=1 Tax=Aurantimonas marianensis TaxID=2920428 RepID=A0A9X2H8S4_9HYPH|nr:glucuronate isomerase [Aurantimonas marianensis]MCP3055873.1 glucuronate isomerase [Aurantimonas marianensis]
MALLDPDRLFPADERTRAVARALYETVRSLPVVSPHGHTDPRWFAENEAFPDPARLFVTPDHYIFRMLVSQGIPLADLGVPSADGTAVETDGRAIWRRFASHYHLFRGTPTRLWLDHSFQTLFDIDRRLSAETADFYYDRISERLAQEAYRPRALFERFDLEVIATTESALDNLAHHRTIRVSGWGGRVVTTYRPDAVVDPDFDGFADNLVRFGEITGCDTTRFTGYLDAHRVRRAFFREHGATATDHGHPTALTADLSRSEAEALYSRVRSGEASAADGEQFRAQMLTEMARLSLEDGMVMQIHAGSRRNHSDAVFAGFGRDKGFDIPQPTNYVAALKPLLDAVGLEPGLAIILFTLDETVYSRELAPLAGAYPCLKLGPPWWFFDSPEGMKRFREQVIETAGFYNTVGFNDDTRAFCSIPARHDVARRADCAYLAELVTTGRLAEDEAFEVAYDLAYRLAKEAYRL